MNAKIKRGNMPVGMLLPQGTVELDVKTQTEIGHVPAQLAIQGRLL